MGADRTPARDPARFRARRPGRDRLLAYRHHFGPEPHRSGWPTVAPSRAESPRGRGIRGRGALSEAAREAADLLRGGDGGWRGGAGPLSPPRGLGRLRAPGPTPAGPRTRLCLLRAREDWVPSFAPKPTNPGAWPPPSPRRLRPRVGRAWGRGGAGTRARACAGPRGAGGGAAGACPGGEPAPFSFFAAENMQSGARGQRLERAPPG